MLVYQRVNDLPGSPWRNVESPHFPNSGLTSGAISDTPVVAVAWVIQLLQMTQAQLQQMRYHLQPGMAAMAHPQPNHGR